MATTPNKDKVPSSTVQNLLFNSEKMDEFATSGNHTYVDRLGNERRTVEGINYAANQAMLNYGYITADSFETGFTLLTPNTVLRWRSNGELYRWDGDWSQPKVVPAGSTPMSTGGIGQGAWVGVGDASLRSQLSSERASVLPPVGTLSSLTGVSSPVGITAISFQGNKLINWVADGDFSLKSHTVLSEPVRNEFNEYVVTTNNGRYTFVTEAVYAQRIQGEIVGFGLTESSNDASVHFKKAFDGGLAKINVQGLKTFNIKKGISIPSGRSIKLNDNPEISYTETRATTTFTSQSIGAFEMLGEKVTGASFLLSGNIMVGDSNIKLSGTGNLKVGDFVLIEQNLSMLIDESSYARQLLEITGISGSSLTVCPPLSHSYAVGNAAKVTKVIPNKGSRIEGDFTCVHRHTSDLRCTTVIMSMAKDSSQSGKIVSKSFGGNSVLVEDSDDVSVGTILGVKPTDASSGRGNSLVIKSSSNVKFAQAGGVDTRHVADVTSGSSYIEGESVILNSSTELGNALNGHGMNSHHITVRQVIAFGGEAAVSMGNTSYKSDYNWIVDNIFTTRTRGALGMYFGSHTLNTKYIKSEQLVGTFCVNIHGEGTGNVTISRMEMTGGNVTYGVSVDFQAKDVTVSSLKIVDVTCEAAVRIAREASVVRISDLNTEKATVKTPVLIEKVDTKANFNVDVIIKGSVLNATGDYSVQVGGEPGGDITTPTGVRVESSACNKPLRVYCPKDLHVRDCSLTGRSLVSNTIAKSNIIGNYGIWTISRAPTDPTVGYYNNIMYPAPAPVV